MRNFESLFDGTLDTWKIPLVDLELKDGTTPVCLRPYPVPRVHKESSEKEVKILIKFGVLEETNYSEWGTPSFSQNESCEIPK